MELAAHPSIEERLGPAPEGVLEPVGEVVGDGEGDDRVGGQQVHHLCQREGGASARMAALQGGTP